MDFMLFIFYSRGNHAATLATTPSTKVVKCWTKINKTENRSMRWKHLTLRNCKIKCPNNHWGTWSHFVVFEAPTKILSTKFLTYIMWLHGAMHTMSFGIIKYFTWKHRSSLPSPGGPFSKVVLSEGISLANKKVKEVLEAPRAK